MIAQPPLVNAPELDQLSLDDLRALIARTSGTPADWHAALVNGQLSGRTRRAIVRGLLRSQTLDAIRSPASGKLALAELGALIDATTWLEPAQVHEVTAVGGKIPVRWTD